MFNKLQKTKPLTVLAVLLSVNGLSNPAKADLIIRHDAIDKCEVPKGNWHEYCESGLIFVRTYNPLEITGGTTGRKPHKDYSPKCQLRLTCEKIDRIPLPAWKLNEKPGPVNFRPSDLRNDTPQEPTTLFGKTIKKRQKKTN